MIEATVQTRPVKGWRGFHVASVGGRLLLCSPYFGNVWDSAVMQANAVPRLDNENGIYAETRPEGWRARSYFNAIYGVTVLGRVELSGVVILHEDGVVRGSEARITRLYVPSAMWTATKGWTPVEFGVSIGWESVAHILPEYGEAYYPRALMTFKSRHSTIISPRGLADVLSRTYGVPAHVIRAPRHMGDSLLVRVVRLIDDTVKEAR